LRRLSELRRAYDRVERAEQMAMRGDPAGAVDEYTKAQELAPENLEIRFWLGLALAGSGRVDEGRALIQSCIAEYDGWAELLRRLPASGLIPDDPALMGALLSR
jgi:Tetratricopeptide repeat